MQTATRTAIEALLNADQTMTATERRAILDACDGPQDAAEIADKLLSTGEAADRLGVSTRTLFRWIDAGKVKPVRMSARLFKIKASDVDALLDARRPPQPDQGESPDRLNAALEHAQHRKEGTA